MDGFSGLYAATQDTDDSGADVTQDMRDSVSESGWNVPDSLVRLAFFLIEER